MRLHRSLALAIVTTMMLAPPALAAGPVTAQGPLSDLQPAAPNATDGGSARVQVTEHAHGSTVTLSVTGLDRGAAGTTLGAHVHVGPCVAGDGGAAGAHYNHGGGVSAETEVWLDFTIRGGGTGHAVAQVPFHIPDGAAQSVVIHALPTDHTGAAGARLACIAIAL